MLVCPTGRLRGAMRQFRWFFRCNQALYAMPDGVWSSSLTHTHTHRPPCHLDHLGKEIGLQAVDHQNHSYPTPAEVLSSGQIGHIWCNMSSSLCGAVTQMSLPSRTQHSPASSAPLSSRFSSALHGQALPSNSIACMFFGTVCMS